ncbi:hypothetical protein J6590_009413 [Homalodisca vitripennis]|nr:hypothetical protein J6590_009413 [Homalodisca vitripennis]
MLLILLQIDYPEVQTARGVGNPRLPPTMDRGGVNLVFDDSGYITRSSEVECRVSGQIFMDKVAGLCSFVKVQFSQVEGRDQALNIFTTVYSLETLGDLVLRKLF